ncbi:MAG: CtsR family transcriptional regulator [Candidatus Fimenecus sp.]
MNISNIIASMISDMLEEDGCTEIQRNELAQKIGCVPSQINYVISSRFTPEHGYIVESRRGGGGYIRITRADFDINSLKMHLVNSIGQSLEEGVCRAHIKNLYEREIIDEKTAKIMLSALCGNAYRDIPKEYGDTVRASIFKQMVLNIL